MANNSNRKAIEFMVQGALPPHSTNVLWMDTSVPTLPVLKIFENGAWTNVHTEDSKSIELLAEIVLAQQNEITELTEDILSKMALDATVAKETTLQAVEQDASAAKVAAQALVPVAAAAEAYNVGKAQLAANITSKGVPASATETLPELAEKVNAITQESYNINGGEMYAKQLFGSLTTPNYWNLYEVLENLLSDGRLVQYGGILLAEYYRDYDSLALAGAGAGGAYVVSDKDSQGNFIMYTNDTTHTWATEFDGRGNRWVAYCFADEYHDFQITDTNTSPRSIFIGRKVGTITYLVAGRLTQLVVTDGNYLSDFVCPFDQEWNNNLTIRIKNHNSGTLLWKLPTNSLYLQLEKLNGGEILNNERTVTQIGGVIVNVTGDGKWYCKNGSFIRFVKTSNDNIRPSFLIFNGLVECKGISIWHNSNGYLNSTNAYMIFPDLETLYGATLDVFYQMSTYKRMYFNSLEEAKRGEDANLNNYSYGHFVACRNIEYIYFGYKTNDRTKSVNIVYRGQKIVSLTDIELKQGYCKNINISGMTDNLTEENIVNHILNKLGDNTGQSPLTITLGATNLAKLTAEEIAIATNKGFTLA